MTIAGVSSAAAVDPSSIEVLVFDVGECRASGPMRDAAERWCDDRAIRFTTIDVWADPASVVQHRVLIGPTVVALVGGEEIGRLAGPASRRRVDRFLESVGSTSPADSGASAVPPRFSNRWVAALVAALALALGACSDSGTETAEAATSAPTTTTVAPTTASSGPATTVVAGPEAKATQPMTIDELGIATVIPKGWTSQGPGAFAGPDASILFGAGPSWALPDPTDLGFEPVATERFSGRTWDVFGVADGDLAVTWAETEIGVTTYLVQLQMPPDRADEIIATVGTPALEAFDVVDPDVVRSALTGDAIEVDGRTVAYATGGDGPTTVVFEAGLGGGMTSWSPVADPVAESSRVFVYDRAGMGGSDTTDAPRDGHRMVTELRAVLAATGHEPPYVVVGHSLGGTLMELYARAFPDEVAGLVLVDSRAAGYTARCVEVVGEATCLDSAEELAREPEPVQAEWRAFPLTEEQVLTAPPPAPIPIVVLAGDRSDGRPDTDAIWVETQRRLAESLGASFVLGEDLGHGIQFERPEMVLDAIDAVLRTVEQTGGATADQPTPDTESE